MLQLTNKIIGSYRIIEQIGAGGMATVFKAYQPAMERYVAFKVISTHLAQAPTFIKRFEQEAKVIARLEHAHILPVHDYGEADGSLYMVMRLIEGGTLKNRIKNGPLTLTETRRVVDQIGSALDYTHRLNVVHRDLKPSNILIDDQGNCYLTDFGIAKLVENSAGLTGSGIVGTPHYMAPEQSKTNKVDRRADIYAMGVVIYEMVTGQVPFDAETPMAILLKHISEPLLLPRKLRPDLPEAVERVIIKAMAKEPGSRYQRMGDLVADFDEAVQTALAKTYTITTSTPPTPMRAAQNETVMTSGTEASLTPDWKQHFPWLLPALILVLVGLILGGGLALLWGLGQAGVGPWGETVKNVTPTLITSITFQPTLEPTETQTAELEPTEPQTLIATLPISTPTVIIDSSPTISPTSPITLNTAAPLATSPTPTITLSPLTPSLTLQPQVSQLASYEDSASNFAWLPDSKRLVIGGRKIAQYDGQTLQQVQEFQRDQISSLSLSADGKMLATVSYYGIKVWDTLGWGEIRTLAGNENAKGVVFSPDGKLLATMSGGAVKLLEVTEANELRDLPAGDSDGPVAFSPDGRILAAMGGAGGREIKLWDTTNWSELSALKGHSNRINSLAFSPDGKVLASGSADNTVRTWDVAGRTQIQTFTGHSNSVESVAFSPDGRLLASASWDLTVRLWDAASGKELNQLTGHTSQVQCVAFSPDGAMLASGSDNQMLLWRIEMR